MLQFGRRILNGLGRVYSAGMGLPDQFNLLSGIGKKVGANDPDVLASQRHRLWRRSNQGLTGLAQAVLLLVASLINGAAVMVLRAGRRDWRGNWEQH